MPEHDASYCPDCGQELHADGTVGPTREQREKAERALAVMERTSKMRCNLRERLAALSHEQWSGWARWMIDQYSPEAIERWGRQIVTPYVLLSEREKDSDRDEADKMLAVIGDQRDRAQRALAVVEKLAALHRRIAQEDIGPQSARVYYALVSEDPLAALEAMLE